MEYGVGGFTESENGILCKTGAWEATHAPTPGARGMCKRGLFDRPRSQPALSAAGRKGALQLDSARIKKQITVLPFLAYASASNNIALGPVALVCILTW